MMTALLNALHRLATLVAAFTVYAAAGATAGSIAALFSSQLDRSPYQAFFFGFLIPPGPLYLLYASKWMMTRRLLMLQDWRTRNLIQDKQYQELRKDLLHWYARRLFGS